MSRFEEDNLEANHALNSNIQSRRTHGFGVISGGAVTINTGTLGSTDTLSLEATDVLVGGTEFNLSSQNIQIDSSNSDPRQDVIYVDSSGNVQVAKGTPQAAQTPVANPDYVDYYTPTPVDLQHVDATVLFRVWVPENASSITSNELIDMRMDADIFADLVDAQSVNADELNNIKYLRSNHDADSVISNLSSGDVLLCQPGTSFNNSQPMEFPSAVSIINWGSWGSAVSSDVVFTKQFNGDHATVREGSKFIGITFEGNKSNGYTGDGVVDADEGNNGGGRDQYFKDVYINNQDGDARVAKGAFFNTYDHCRFDQAGGWGIRHTETNSHPSQNHYINGTQFSRCEAGGVFYDNVGVNGHVYSERYDGVSFNLNNGPCIRAKADVRDFELSGRVGGNDGPVFLLQEYDDGSRAHLRSSRLYVYERDNVQSAPSYMDGGGLSEYGSVLHANNENVTVDSLTIKGEMDPATGNGVAPVVAHTPNFAEVSINGNNQYSEVAIVATGCRVWQKQSLGPNGKASGSSATGNSGEVWVFRDGYAHELIGDSETYLGWYSAPPTTHASSVIYFDDGSRTADGNPGWRYTTDGGSTWNDLN